MGKWIEGTLAAMIWSCLMLLLLTKRAVMEKQLGLADPNSLSSSGGNSRLKPRQLPIRGHGAGIRA